MPKGGMGFMTVVLRSKETGNKTSNLTTTASLINVDQSDINSDNNQASFSTVTPSAVDISVTQKVTGVANYNNNVTYTITVKNNGPDSASGVKVTDILPAGLIIQGSPVLSQGSYNPVTGLWDIGNLSNNQTVTLTIIAKINATGTIKNTVKKTAQNEYDWNFDNNAQTTVFLVSGNYTPSVDIRVTNYPWYATTVNGTKTYLDKYAYSNTPIFTVDVRNVGGVDDVNYADATGVVVQYVIGSGYDFIAADTKFVGYTTFANNVLTWYIGDMPKGGMGFMTVVLRSKESGNKTSNLTTTASLINVDQSDINSDNNQASFSTVTPSAVDISVTQKVTGVANYNNNVTYTITVKNNGPDSASGVKVTDTFTCGFNNSRFTCFKPRIL